MEISVSGLGGLILIALVVCLGVMLIGAALDFAENIFRGIGNFLIQWKHGPIREKPPESTLTGKPQGYQEPGYFYEFARPSVTATILLVDEEHDEFLAGIRGDEADVFPGTTCIPGGFLDAKISPKDAVGGAKLTSRKGERVEQTAVREVLEETGIQLEEKDLILIDVRSNPDVDPRAHVVNVCYMAQVTQAQRGSAGAADDLSGLFWRTFKEFEQQDTVSSYAFDHYHIINNGLRKLREIRNCKRLAAKEVA